MHTQWGSDTYISPQQREALSNAEQPLFCGERNIKKKLSKAPQSLIRLNIQLLPLVRIIIFDDFKHYITFFKTVVEYFSLSN